MLYRRKFEQSHYILHHKLLQNRSDSSDNVWACTGVSNSYLLFLWRLIVTVNFFSNSTIRSSHAKTFTIASMAKADARLCLLGVIQHYEVTLWDHFPQTQNWAPVETPAGLNVCIYRIFVQLNFDKSLRLPYFAHLVSVSIHLVSIRVWTSSWNVCHSFLCQILPIEQVLCHR
jgi:hypothetical protein